MAADDQLTGPALCERGPPAQARGRAAIMDVEFLEEHKMALNAGVEQTWPKGWKGVIDDGLAWDLIERQICRSILPKAGSFSPEQTATLQKIANSVEAQAKQAAETLDAINLDDLSIKELRELADEIDVAHDGVKKADLRARLQARLDDIVGGDA